jgi:hypothetical protein
MTPPLHMTCKLLVLASFEVATLFLSHMNKCCFGVIILWCCFVGSGSCWGPNSSRHLCNCDTTTFGSPTVPNFSIGLSISLSTGDFGLATPNVNDRVFYLSSGNCVSGESEASPNVDINVLTKTLILKKNIYFQKPTTFFLKSQGFNKV